LTARERRTSALHLARAGIKELLRSLELAQEAVEEALAEPIPGQEDLSGVEIGERLKS